MASEVLQGIANDIGKINAQIAEAEDLLRAAQEAGESTATMDADIRNLKIRKEKWERMLKGRGINIPG